MDFKHKKKQETLWFENQWNPPLVTLKMVAMALGTMQLNVFHGMKKLTKYVNDGQLEKGIQQEAMHPNIVTFVQVK